MKGTEKIVIDYNFRESPTEVWRALTDSKLLAQWLMANDMEAVVGHKFTFREAPQGDWDGIVHCEVLEVDPPNKLVYSWKGGNGPNDPEFPRLDSVVTWTLEASPEGGTSLHLLHDGFQPTDYAFEVIGSGWRSLLTQETMSRILTTQVVPA